MDAVAVANELPIRTLRRCRIGETPRPRQWNADHAAIDQMSRNSFVGHHYVTDPILNADHSAHAMPL